MEKALGEIMIDKKIIVSFLLVVVIAMRACGQFPLAITLLPGIGVITISINEIINLRSYNNRSWSGSLDIKSIISIAFYGLSLLVVTCLCSNIF